MRVSVIVPCRNARRTIAEALRSAAAQTRPPTEILVVDDGSTDGSADQIAASGVTVRFLRADRANAAAARNQAIRAATGDFIAYLDADDLWLPHHLARAAGMLEGSADVAYMAHWERFGDRGPVEQFAPLPVASPAPGLSHAQFFTWFAAWRYFCHSGTVIRRDAVVAAGLFDESLVRRHDYELFLRAIHGKTWSYDPRVGWRYRADTEGAISRQSAEASRYFLAGLLKNRALYPGREMERMIREQARNAVAAAFTTGDAVDRQRALALARPELSARDRLIFGAAARAPRVFRILNRARLRLRGIPASQ